MRLTELAPTFETRWLIEGKNEFPGELRMGRNAYHVFGSLVQSDAGQMMMLHFLDCSLEAGALFCLPYAKLTDSWRPLSREYVVIPPESVRILSVSRYSGLPV